MKPPKEGTGGVEATVFGAIQDTSTRDDGFWYVAATEGHDDFADRALPG
jgi:hypothetical protein